jgi:hypothetical protein
MRDAGRNPFERDRRPKAIDPFLDKVEEWVDDSLGKIRADVAHRKLVAMGFTGNERSTRRAVAEAKAAWKAGRRRTYRPWVPEPGLWLQFDWGKGPDIGERKTWLFCAWLAWSRFRSGIPRSGRPRRTWTRCSARSAGFRRSCCRTTPRR